MCHFGTYRAGWLRQSPPSQEQENTEETEPRETLPEISPSRSPLPKRRQQLQILLHRLPDFILHSALFLPKRCPPCPDQCAALSHPKLSQLLTQPAISHSSHCTPHCPPELSQPVMHPTPSLSTHPIKDSTHVSHSAPHCPPELSQPVTHPTSPLSPHPITDSTQKTLLLRLHRLPQSLVQSALHLHTCISSSQPQALTEVSSKLCFQEHSKSEVQYPDVLTETHRANKDKTVQVLPQTINPHTQLQEGTQEEQEDRRGELPEEEKDTSVKETVQQNCPTTDQHYVLRSQNPADCASVNTLTGLTNGFPQKGLSQKFKIRVDFKVSFCSCVGWQLYICIQTTVIMVLEQEINKTSSNCMCNIVTSYGIIIKLLIYISLSHVNELMHHAVGTDHSPLAFLFLPLVHQEDCAVQNVWLMGGLSVLTSVPTTPQPVCLLCASKGRHEVILYQSSNSVTDNGFLLFFPFTFYTSYLQSPCLLKFVFWWFAVPIITPFVSHFHQMIFCQICCEPFHSFCLSPEERPQKENRENWCCRRCKFCHVCGRRSKSTKVCNLASLIV